MDESKGPMETHIKTKFRHMKKEGLEFQVPPKLADHVRSLTRHGRRSLSSVGTEILAKGLGLDPAEFGVEAESATSA